MLALLYRWRIEPGMEDRCVDGWYRGTRANHASCGSYRQHRAANGTRFAYARWPEAARRDACDHGESEGPRMAPS
jgi:hypothetical protein